MSKKKKLGLGVAAAGVVAGAVAAGVAVYKRSKSEQVYHEAELKAMDELEEMMRAESDCASCACAEECAAADVPCEDTFDEKVPDEAEEEAPAEAAEEQPAAEEEKTEE